MPEAEQVHSSSLPLHQEVPQVVPQAGPQEGGQADQRGAGGEPVPVDLSQHLVIQREDVPQLRLRQTISGGQRERGGGLYGGAWKFVKPFLCFGINTT